MAKFYYGGQAVMEGVMMRGQRHMAVAVRAPNGKIVVHNEPLNAAIYRNPAMKMPFLRGVVGLWDALGLGMKALMFSADVALQDAEATQTAQRPQSVEAAVAASQEKGEKQGSKESGAFSGPAAWTSIMFALAVMVGVFFVLPVLAAGLVANVVNNHANVFQNVVEGVIRLGLFLGYIAAIGRMRDIQRVFGYHGAEHKTINAYEAGVELTPERVQEFTLLNPRCGTTFLLVVMLLATLVFVVIGKMPFPLMVLSRIVLVPVIASIAYEFIRLMANLYDHAVVRALIAPGLALQRMTTRPPDLTMIEVGIAALESVLVADGVIAKGKLPEPIPAEAVEPAAAIV